MQQPNHDKQRFNNAEAADYIGVDPGTLANWRTSGKNSIPYYKFGSGPQARIRYDKADLHAFLANSKVAA